MGRNSVNIVYNLRLSLLEIRKALAQVNIEADPARLGILVISPDLIIKNRQS